MKLTFKQKKTNLLKALPWVIAFGATMITGCDTLPKDGGKYGITPIAKPISVSPDLKVIDTSGQNIATTAKAIKEEATENQSKVPAAAPLLLTIGGQADHILGEAVTLDAALDRAQAQDAKNQTNAKQLTDAVTNLQAENAKLDKEIAKAKSDYNELQQSWYRRILAIAFLAGIACFPIAALLFFYLHLTTPAYSVAGAGAATMAGVMFGQALLRLEPVILWSLAVVVIGLIAYAGYEAFRLMKTRFEEMTETAKAVAAIPPTDTAAITAAISQIQSQDTKTAASKVATAAAVTNVQANPPSPIAPESQ